MLQVRRAVTYDGAMLFPAFGAACAGDRPAASGGITTADAHSAAVDIETI